MEKNKKLVITVVVILLVVAGVLDLMFKGLLYNILVSLF